MYPIENSGDLIKNKHRQLFSREMWVGVGSNGFFLGLTSLLTDISSEMVTATLPLYLLLTLRLAPLQFGLIDGINQVASILVRIASGLIADRWQRTKEVASAGYAFSAICRIGLLLVGRSWLGISGVVLLDRIGKGIRTARRDGRQQRSLRQTGDCLRRAPSHGHRWGHAGTTGRSGIVGSDSGGLRCSIHLPRPFGSCGVRNSRATHSCL